MLPIDCILLYKVLSPSTSSSIELLKNGVSRYVMIPWKEIECYFFLNIIHDSLYCIMHNSLCLNNLRNSMLSDQVSQNTTRACFAFLLIIHFVLRNLCESELFSRYNIIENMRYHRHVKASHV